MYVDWSVELGADDPVLDFPWGGQVSSHDRCSDKTRSERTTSGEARADAADSNHGGSAETTLRYYDLKTDPSLIDQLPETQSSSELRKFLLRVNAAGFPLQSAKCDHWFTQEISEEEEIFGAPCKYGSYVDLLFTSSEKQLSFADHEEFAAKLCGLLKGVPEMPASAEVVVRRCFYADHSASEVESTEVESNDDESTSGYYFTVYVSGFGETEAQSRQQWSIALTLVQHALVQSTKHLAANQRE